MAAAGYLQYKESEQQRRYQRAKLEAKQLQSQQASKKKIEVEEDSSSDDSLSHSQGSTNSGRVGGAKEELAKAEGVMRSNSSYVELTTTTLTKRMRDESTDHTKVLSES